MRSVQESGAGVGASGKGTLPVSSAKGRHTCLGKSGEQVPWSQGPVTMGL